MLHVRDARSPKRTEHAECTFNTTYSRISMPVETNRDLLYTQINKTCLQSDSIRNAGREITYLAFLE